MGDSAMPTIQGIYVAIFGRPIDPAGLVFWNGETNNGADLSKMVGALSASAEFKALYDGKTNTEIVTAIYQSLFGRAPDAAGLDFYLKGLQDGTLNIESIAISVLDGALGSDKTIVDNKIAAADVFTAHLDLQAEIDAYSGTSAADIGRAYLAPITSDKATIPTTDGTDATILTLFNPDGGQAPVGGGGGGGGGGGPVADTTAPTFTSSATFSLDENKTDVGTVAATDPSGPIAYALAAGGVDNGFFDINPTTGALTFKTAPDGDAPADAGGDNVYDIRVEATDAATNSATQDVAVTVIDVNDFIVDKATGHPSGVPAFDTITGAVAVAPAGAQIVINGPGPYNETVTVDKAFTFVGGTGGKPVVTGGGFNITGDINNGGSATVTISGIDFENNATGVRVASNVVLDNLVITDSEFEGNTVHGVGAGSGADGLAAVTIKNSIFTNNGQGGTNGSGDIVLFAYKGDATIEGVQIVSNKADGDTAASKGDNAIQISGFVPATYDVTQPIGTVSLKDVTVTGSYEKPHLSIQGYNDLSGASFSNVSLDGSSNWGFLVFIDPSANGVEGAAAGAAGNPGAYVGGAPTSTLDLSGIQVTNSSSAKTTFDVFVRGTGANDTLTGSAGDDVLNALSDAGQDLGGDDVLNGGAGNDTLFGGKDDDSLTGGSGDDTAVFVGSRENFNITKTGLGTYQIVDTNLADGNEGTDTLSGIEFLRFGSDLFSYELDANSPDTSALTQRFGQGFETGTDGIIFDPASDGGNVTVVSSGTGGITSASGAFHAIFEQTPGAGGPGSESGPFTRFDGYRDTFQTYKTEVDVYLKTTWANGEGFDYSVAANGSDNAHQRDFIFHVTKDTSTGKLLIGGSNNTNFAPIENLETGNHAVVDASGWYTFEHVFSKKADNTLEVAMNVYDAAGDWIFTEVSNTAADTIPGDVGGNRYGWFTNIDITGGIAVDNVELFGF
jgi:hypothetical protein